MPRDFMITCGSAVCTRPEVRGQRRVPLHLTGSERNVILRLEAIDRAAWRNSTPVLQDLAEIAAYVYAADLRCSRGSTTDRNYGDDWRRRLHFFVPVRQLQHWRRPRIQAALVEALSFLSEDEYSFDFQQLERLELFERYLEFGTEAFGPVDEVLLFSGGADSLAGAAEAVLTRRARVVLIFHQSNPKRVARVGGLARELGNLAPDRRPNLITLNVRRTQGGATDPYQRARSFLYAALGTVAAVLFRRDRLRFYENGVVSINLPLAGQVLGSRASRTTHPEVLCRFTQFFSELLDERFVVENPYAALTKTEVLQRLRSTAAASLLAKTESCASPRLSTLCQPHCGVCSQCLDRRFAALAASMEEYDPASGYRVELFAGERAAGRDQAMLAAFVASARAMADLSEVGFCSHYGEMTRVLPHLGETNDLAAHRVRELHRRQARTINGVVEAELARRVGEIYRACLPPRSLLDMIVPRTQRPTEVATPAALATAAFPDGPNVFVRRGTHWSVRFAGGEVEIYTHERGMDYLRILLGQPHRPADASRMVGLVLGHARTARSAQLGLAAARAIALAGGDLSPATEVDDLPDEVALASYRLEYGDLEGELEQARQRGDEAAVLKICGQMDFLHAEIARGGGTLADRARLARSDRKRLVAAVGNAIRRAVRQIRRYNRGLATHLSRPIVCCGAHPCYNPPERTEWLT